ncbi:uncharacterized protein PAC_02252 [Phialocephala subalpina]|uniref:Uncharacterized protein n=1 Tax=Phialocephala subalpina TaxID=576137 RepID=A0A1L7WHX3_9HELO|nr:uncharacterized protein PAC_02252 [Phialocephala subalpina]
MVQTRSRKAAATMVAAQTKKKKVTTTKAVTTMEDIQATLAAEDEEDEGGSTQNDQASSSNADKEHSSRASSLSPPPEDIQEPKWDMTQDNDQRDEQGKQDDGIEDTSAIKRERSFAKRNWQLAQQDDDAEDTIVIDTTTRKAERSSDQSHKKSAQKQNNAKETTAIEPKAKYDETTWTRFERPTEQQKKDYYARGNKSLATYPLGNRLRRSTSESKPKASSKQKQPKKPNVNASRRSSATQSSSIKMAPNGQSERSGFDHLRKIQDDKLKIDVRNGVFKEQRGAVYYAETNGHDWRIRQELGEVKSHKYGLDGLKTYF